MAQRTASGQRLGRVRPAAEHLPQLDQGGRCRLPGDAGPLPSLRGPSLPLVPSDMIARAAKRLESIVSISFVEPFVFDHGWTFAQPDPLTGIRYIHELYSQADPLFTGRATLPVLWDKETNTIVSNESADIIRMFDHEFDDITNELTDYYPQALSREIDQISEIGRASCRERV